MTRRIFAVLLVAVCLFSGCGNSALYPEGMNITCKDLALTIPGDFADLSAEESARDADFMYGRKTLVFSGLSQPKADLQDMSLSQYTNRVIEDNQVPCIAVPTGGGYLFTYEKTLENTVYIYTVATYEPAENFWILQFFGPSADSRENQPEIDIILASLRKKA